MESPGNPEDFRTDFSEWCFNNFDAKYAQHNVKQGYFDPNLIQEFFTDVRYILTGKEIIVYLKKFVDFILSKRAGPPEKLPVGGAKHGELKIWTNMPKNMIVIEGEGSPSPIVDICNFRPLFHIQRGYLLILRNVRIEYRGNSDGIFQESGGPSFLLDPDTSSLVKVDKCRDRPGEGLFILRNPVWVGDPARNPYKNHN